jgi:hypothetical protein
MFGGEAWFGGSNFRSSVEFDDVIFDAGVDLNHARALRVTESDSERIWPNGWQAEPRQTEPHMEDDEWIEVLPAATA